MSINQFEWEAIQNIEQRGSNHFPRNDADVRPGGRMGLTVEQIQQYIQKQKKSQGYNVTVSTGSNTSLSNVELPGTARVMLGFAFTFTELTDPAAEITGRMTMKLNNEIMIDETLITMFGAGFTDEEYYFFPRPLSGNDKLEIQIDGVITAYSLNGNFVYL